MWGNSDEKHLTDLVKASSERGKLVSGSVLSTDAGGAFPALLLTHSRCECHPHNAAEVELMTQWILQICSLCSYVGCDRSN